MAIGYRLDDGLLEVTVEGDHEFDDFIACVAEAERDPRWTGTAYLLIDIRRSPAVTRRTPQEIRRGFEILTSVPGRFRWCTALLVSSGLQEEAMVVASRRADFIGGDVRAFYDRAEAIAWLRGHGDSDGSVASAERVSSDPASSPS